MEEDTTIYTCGRPKHPIWRYFIRGDKRNKCHFKAYCKFCVDAQGLDGVKSVRGVTLSMIRHLESCEKCPDSVLSDIRSLVVQIKQLQQTKGDKKGSKLDDDTMLSGLGIVSGALGSSPAPHTQPKQKKRKSTSNSTGSGRGGVTGGVTGVNSKAVSNFSIDQLLIKATISAGLPFNWTENPEVKTLFKHCCINDPNLPSKNEMTDKILNSSSTELFKRYMDRIKESRLGCTMTINHWYTSKNQQYLSYCLTSPIGETMTFSIQEIANYEANVNFFSTKVEETLEEIRLQNIKVMAIVSQHPLTYSIAQKNIREKNSDILVFPCFAQALNVLAADLLTDKTFVGVVAAAMDVANYFANHLPSSKPLDPNLSTIIRANTKNWESILRCITMLKQSKDAINCASFNGNMQDNIGEILQSVGFWEGVEQISTIGKTLLESSELLEQKTINISDVFHSLVKMYFAFNEANSMNPSIISSLIQRIEYTWSQMETPLMLLGCVLNFHLNPWFLDTSKPFVHWMAIGKYAKYYYEQFFGESPTQLIEDLHSYKEGLYPFEAETMKDYSTPESFYSCIFDSNPEISRLACRIFSIIPRGCSSHFQNQTFANSVIKTNLSCNQALACLHVKHGISNTHLAQKFKHIKEESNPQQATHFKDHEDASKTIWNGKQWAEIADEWRKVLNTDQTVQIPVREGNSVANSKATLKSLLKS